jgi:hypothetical protein
LRIDQTVTKRQASKAPERLGLPEERGLYA